MAQRNKKILRKLNHQYRLVVMEETTLKERNSIGLTGFNVLLIVSITMVVFFGLYYLLFKYTPMQKLVVGSSSMGMSKEMLINTDRHLSHILERNEISLKREIQLRNILTKKITAESSKTIEDRFIGINTSRSKEEDKSSADKDVNKQELQDVEVKRNNFVLYPPIKGEVSRGFDIRSHAAVDIIPSQDDDVHSAMDGIVVFSSWTPEFGHVIALQHSENLISIYKHNSVLFKKVGTFVEAGETIAVVGNSGELTSGKHLHFELWDDGKVVDPENYINF